MPPSRRQQTWCGYCAMRSLTAADLLSQQRAGPGLANVVERHWNDHSGLLVSHAQIWRGFLKESFSLYSMLQPDRANVLGHAAWPHTPHPSTDRRRHSWLTTSIWRGRLYAPVCLARLGACRANVLALRRWREPSDARQCRRTHEVCLRQRLCSLAIQKPS
jgi:hypothetical protein